jgi:hypothetical protein
MAPRLSIALGAAIDRDFVALEADFTSQQISMLVANYSCSSRTPRANTGWKTFASSNWRSAESDRATD